MGAGPDREFGSRADGTDVRLHQDLVICGRRQLHFANGGFIRFSNNGLTNHMHQGVRTNTGNPAILSTYDLAGTLA